MGTAQGFRELWGKAFFLLLLTVAAWPAYAATWYVAPDGSGGGTSWQDAGALQATVNAASTGDEVWVAAGTYTAATDPVLTMKAGVALYGGFSGTESERDQRDWTTQVTTIDGEDMRRCVIGANDAVLDGFVITRGTSDFRGGMYNDNASPTVTNCTFTGNTSSGMHNSTSSPTVTNCTFTENSRHGMDNDYSSPTVTNCTFTGNSGGMKNQFNASPTVTNCIIWGNGATGISEINGVPSVTYSCVRGGISGEGNIDVDPMLLAAPGKPKIHPHSPCIDAGTSDGAPDTDIMGNPRPQGAGVDMGAYEGEANEDLVVLTINTSPADMGRTTPPKGLYCFERGDTVLITAQDMFGLFKNWSGDVSGDTREISVVMDADKTATAVFDENIYYVKADSTAESPDGRSWESAYATLQEAVDRAGEDGGGSIWATAGLYTSAAANVLYMKERVSVFGGFSGVETELDQRDWKNNPTVIDGESMRRCVHGADVTLLDGLHIVNGFVYEANGGGISNHRAETQVMNCIFTNNIADYGGAIACISSESTITNCVFTDNRAAFWGGAITIFDDDSSSLIVNCTLTNNRATCEGGAVYCYFSPTTMIKNSILWGNNAATYPESSEGASISYSCVRGGISGEGNMDVDPRLLTSPGIPKLQFNSPCIDAGTLLSAPSVDIEGNPRPQGMGVDMGAYEEGVQDEDWVTLTINIIPAGAGITRPPEGQYIFERGDIARIAAQNMGGLFTHWTGDVSMNEPEISFVMDGDKTVAAVFSDNIYFVNINSIDPNPDGRSWETAFSSLQDAVNMAEEDGGGEVWVAAGTYTATTDTMLTMREGVALYGGFSGVEASRDKRNWKTSPTLFRGSIYGADRAILDGFHITGGYSEYVGGGMYIRHVSPIIRNCLFTSNSAYHGGAIYITYGASPHISNCSFIANNANADGGAVYIDYYCTAQFTNCYFDNNRASHHGGAVFSNWYSFPYFYHCTFRQNVAGIGGGIWAWDSVLRNCILWGNVNWAGGDDEISCEGTSMVTFSCIFGGFDGIGNIDLDPLFSGGYKLQSGSPCIDAGTSEGAPDTDIEGIPRPQGKGWDMGAYEYAPIVVILAGEAELVLACDAPYVEAGLASVLDIRDGEVVDLVEPASVPVLIWQQAALLYTSNLMYIENDFNNPDVIARPIPPKQEAYTLSYEVTGSTGDPGTATRIVHLECPLTEEGEAEEGETPIEGEGEKLTEGEGEIPAEGEALPEDEGETPAEGEGEVLPEGEGETPAEGEGEALPEGEGETPAEGEGEVLPEGEGETPTEGEGEALPEGEGETRAEGEGEALPEGEGEISAEGEAPGEGEGEPEEEPGCGCSGCDGHDKLLDAPRHFLGNWLLIGLTLLVCCWEFQRFRN